jgi:hypothetical protein
MNNDIRTDDARFCAPEYTFKLTAFDQGGGSAQEIELSRTEYQAALDCVKASREARG